MGKLYCSMCEKKTHEDSFSAVQRRANGYRFCLIHTAGAQRNWIRTLEARAASENARDGVMWRPERHTVHAGFGGNSGGSRVDLHSMERARTGPTHDRERQIREEMDRANSSFGESEYESEAPMSDFLADDGDEDGDEDGDDGNSGGGYDGGGASYSSKRRKAAKLSVNDCVRTRWTDGKWYDATIKEVLDGGRYEVIFDDGQEYDVVAERNVVKRHVDDDACGGNSASSDGTGNDACNHNHEEEEDDDVDKDDDDDNDDNEDATKSATRRPSRRLRASEAKRAGRKQRLLELTPRNSGSPASLQRRLSSGSTASSGAGSGFVSASQSTAIAPTTAYTTPTTPTPSTKKRKRATRAINSSDDDGGTSSGSDIEVLSTTKFRRFKAKGGSKKIARAPPPAQPAITTPVGRRRSFIEDSDDE